jgi:hypothetical protein
MNKKKIQRGTDNKYLVNLEQDTWTDDEKQATEFSWKQFHETKGKLLKTYKAYDIVEIDA